MNTSIIQSSRALVETMARESLRKKAFHPFFDALFILTVSLVLVAPSHAQIKKVEKASSVLVKIPTLEVQLFTGDFEQWGQEIVIYSPRSLRFRWGKPVLSESFEWKLYDSKAMSRDLVRQGIGTRPRARAHRVIASGEVSSTPDVETMSEFRIDLAGLLAASPGDKTRVYEIEVVPKNKNQVATNRVRLEYKRDESSTQFSFLKLYPEFLRPMRTKVRLSSMKIIKADEECDEEPYLIPVVAYMDGTTINVLDLAGSSVRIAKPARYNAHGNVSTDDDICSGESLSIPKETGYFENTILPVNIELAGMTIPGCTSGGSDCRIGYRQLTKATTVWLFVIAMEEDANDDADINVARDAVVERLRQRLNTCVTSMELSDIENLIRNGLDVKDALTKNEEGIEFCGLTSQKDESILAQIRKRLKELAIDTAMDEILFQPINLFHGAGINIFDDLLDSDDYIGFGYKVFTYDQLMMANGHFPFEINIHKRDNGGPEEAGLHPVKYQITGSVARCEPDESGQYCVTQTRPLLWKFP